MDLTFAAMVSGVGEAGMGARACLGAAQAARKVRIQQVRIRSMDFLGMKVGNCGEVWW
jgi:hypothetical protein